MWVLLLSRQQASMTMSLKAFEYFREKFGIHWPMSGPELHNRAVGIVVFLLSHN